MNIWMNNAIIFSIYINSSNSVVSAWHQEEMTIDMVEGNVTLMFEMKGSSDGYGIYLDDIFLREMFPNNITNTSNTNSSAASNSSNNSANSSNSFSNFTSNTTNSTNTTNATNTTNIANSTSNALNGNLTQNSTIIQTNDSQGIQGYLKVML